MDKEFYDKYSKDLECSCCQDLQHCINGKEPLKINCAIHYFKDKIVDLKAKLAVADDCADRYWEQLKVEQNYINQLKQQLAEKDNEIEDYKKMHWNMQYQHLQEIDELSKLTAIAELEKVKENMNNLYREHKPIYFDLLLIRNTIDQQIKSLKGDL